jgi:hypothetical protein
MHIADPEIRQIGQFKAVDSEHLHLDVRNSEGPIFAVVGAANYGSFVSLDEFRYLLEIGGPNSTIVAIDPGMEEALGKVADSAEGMYAPYPRGKAPTALVVSEEIKPGAFAPEAKNNLFDYAITVAPHPEALKDIIMGSYTYLKPGGELQVVLGTSNHIGSERVELPRLPIEEVLQEAQAQHPDILISTLQPDGKFELVPVFDEDTTLEDRIITLEQYLQAFHEKSLPNSFQHYDVAYRTHGYDAPMLVVNIEKPTSGEGTPSTRVLSFFDILPH